MGTLTLVPPAPTWLTATSPRMLRCPAMWSTWPLLVPTRSTTTAKTPPARPLSRPPVVVQDNTCPTCKVPGGTSTITVEASFPYTEEQSTCTDPLDGAMPNAHVYGTVDVEKTGTYVLTYSVTDKNGNGDGRTCTAPSGAKTDHFTKTVVVEDTMIPIISLKYRGTNPVGMMAEQSTTTVNGWVIGAVASAVSGVALLGYAATRKATVATSVPV